MLGAMWLNQRGGRAYERMLKRDAGMSFAEAVGTDVLEESAIRSLAAWVTSAADAWLQE